MKATAGDTTAAPTPPSSTTPPTTTLEKITEKLETMENDLAKIDITDDEDPEGPDPNELAEIEKMEAEVSNLLQQTFQELELIKQELSTTVHASEAKPTEPSPLSPSCSTPTTRLRLCPGMWTTRGIGE